MFFNNLKFGVLIGLLIGLIVVAALVLRLPEGSARWVVAVLCFVVLGGGLLAARLERWAAARRQAQAEVDAQQAIIDHITRKSGPPIAPDDISQSSIDARKLKGGKGWN